MKSLFARALLFAVSLGVLSALRADAPAGQWYTSAFDHVLGTSLELKFETTSVAAAARAERAALAEIDRLAAIVSGYDAGSEFNRWFATHGEPVVLSPELFELLSLFDAWRIRTGGALDASAETANQLWKTAAERKAVPTSAELEQTVAAMQQTHWRLDPATRTAIHLTTTPLRLNSFAKSYIIDHAAAAALHAGDVATAVVNIGGDIVVRGASVEAIAVIDPAAAAENDEPLGHLQVRNRAVATSGDYRRGVDIGGTWYSHIIDPRTAMPTRYVRGATVASPSAPDAGALATALCVLDPADGRKLAATFPDTEFLLVLADGTVLPSAGWAALAGDSVAPAVFGAVSSLAIPDPMPQAGKKGGRGNDVLINLEVGRAGGGRARRPFVAVWIENDRGIAVRTVALWYKGGRWLPELRTWNRTASARGGAESVASATRGPGQYTLRWDGKDDTGTPLAPGRYTVVIEAAREHGTHQVIRGEIDTTTVAGRVDLAGNIEITAASLEVRSKQGP